MQIVHLSLSPLEFDARIKRQIAALRADGFDASALAPGAGLAMPPLTRSRKAATGLVYPSLRPFGARGAVSAFWSFPRHRRALAALLRARPGAIHAHDWDALAVGVAAGRRLGVPVIYDSHEYAGAVHAERRLWRLVMSPAIRRIEAHYAPSCRAVVAVSQGIADLLFRDLNLAEQPLVLRNMPDLAFPDEAPRDGDGRLLHYHGILARGRGIERLVAALPLLPPAYSLRVLGPERQPGFVCALRAQAARLGVGGRVAVEPAVPPEDLVRAAGRADFGFCLLDRDSPHNTLALPNKLFEFIMAGLFTVVSDNPEMAEVVRSHDAGAVLADTGPAALAAAVMSVSTDRLAQVRRENLATARKLNWAAEAPKLLALYERLGFSRSV